MENLTKMMLKNVILNLGVVPFSNIMIPVTIDLILIYSFWIRYLF